MPVDVLQNPFREEKEDDNIYQWPAQTVRSGYPFSDNQTVAESQANEPQVGTPVEPRPGPSTGARTTPDMIRDVFLGDGVDMVHMAKRMQDEQYFKDRGFFGDLASATVGGALVHGPKIISQFVRGATPEDPSTGIPYWINKLATSGSEALTKAEKDNPFLQPNPYSPTAEKWVHGPIRGVASALVAMAPATLAGTAIGGPAGGVGGAATAASMAIGGAGMFGFAKYQDVLDKAKEFGISREEVEPIARAEGLLDAALMGVGGWILGGSGKALTTVGKEALQNGLSVILRTSLNPVAKHLAKSGAVMGIQGAVTSGLSAELERSIKLGDSNFWDTAVESLGPGVVSGVIFGAIGEGSKFLNRRGIRSALVNPDIDIDARLNAVKEVGSHLHGIDPAIASVWMENAIDAVRNKTPIDIKAGLNDLRFSVEPEYAQQTGARPAGDEVPIYERDRSVHGYEDLAAERPDTYNRGDWRSLFPDQAGIEDYLSSPEMETERARVAGPISSSESGVETVPNFMRQARWQAEDEARLQEQFRLHNQMGNDAYLDGLSPIDQARALNRDYWNERLQGRQRDRRLGRMQAEDEARLQEQFELRRQAENQSYLDGLSPIDQARALNRDYWNERLQGRQRDRRLDQMQAEDEARLQAQADQTDFENNLDNMYWEDRLGGRFNRKWEDRLNDRKMDRRQAEDEARLQAQADQTDFENNLDNMYWEDRLGGRFNRKWEDRLNDRKMDRRQAEDEARLQAQADQTDFENNLDNMYWEDRLGGRFNRKWEDRLNDRKMDRRQADDEARLQAQIDGHFPDTAHGSTPPVDMLTGDTVVPQDTRSGSRYIPSTYERGNWRDLIQEPDNTRPSPAMDSVPGGGERPSIPSRTTPDMPPEPDVRPVNNWSHDISDPQIRTLDEWRSKSAEHGVTLNAFRIDNGSDVYVRNPRNGNTVAIKPDGSIARLNADANAHIDNLDYANRLEPVRHNDDVRVEMEQKARHEAAIAESRRIEDGYYQGRAPSDPQWKREDGKWYRLDGESKWVRHIAKKGLPSSVELERDRKIGNLKRIRGLDEEPQMARPESDAVDPLNDTTPTEPEVKAYESASPAESSPAESSPAESYPAESYPVESSPVESSPVESSPAVTVEKQSIPVVDRSKKNYKEANGKHVSISKTITQSGKKNVDVILYDPDTRDVTPGFQIRRGRDDNGWAVVSKGDWVTDSLGRSKQEEVTEARFEDLKAAKAYAVSRLNGEIRNPSDTIRHEPYTPKKRGLSGISDPVETEDGFLSDGAMAVIPKTMPESTNKFSVNILDHLGISDDLTPIESVSQYSHPESPTEYVHVVSEGKHSFYNRLYVDRVMTEHPDANPSVFRKTKKDEWTLIFTDKSGKIVGVVMPMIIEKRSGIYKGAVSRSKGTPKDDSTLSFSIKPPDGKDPGIDVVMAKDRANDPDLQFSLNTLKEWEDVHRRERIKRDIDPDTVVEHVEKIGRLGRILNERPDLLEEEGTGNPIRKNIEYGKSGDLNTNCQRRFEYKADIERIEKKLERLMTPDEMFGLSALLKSQGKLAPCVYCYVEGARRQWNGVMHAYEQRRADAFAYMDKNGKPTVEDLGQAIIEKWDKKAGIKILKDLIDEWFESTSNGEKPYHFTTRLIADSEFRTSEFERDPRSVEVYKTAVKYATVRSLANTPKPFDPYRGQFFAVKGKARHLQSIRAGWRFFSTTDAQVNHIPDLMQMVVDLALMGDKAHAYTKEPWFVNVFGETGMKINMSIFAEGGLNGEPIREPVAGNNGMAWSEARALRDKFDNAGTIFVATNDAQIRWALDQSWIDMIIPWHRSGISEAQGKALGYTDYSGVQHEKWIDGSNKGKPPKIFENQHKNDLATYRRILEEKGLRPKFEDFYDHPNYMKLVIDATRPEIEQKPVKPNFDYKYAEQTIRDWQKAGGYSLAQAGSQEIVDAMLAKIRNKEPMFSQKSILPEETKALEGMVASDLEAGLKDTARSWESALPGGFNIVQSESELPSNYRGRIMSYGQESRVEAFYDPKTKSVWMIADNISDIDRAKSRAIHEVIGHHGVDTILKKGGDRFFNDLFVAKNKEILDYIEKNRSDIDPNANRVQAAKEWFADEIAAGRHQSKGLVGWWNRFVRLFNEGLRKFGFDMKLADSEISDIATRAWQYVEERSMPFGMELSSGPEMGKIRGDVDLQTSLATDRASKAERPEPGAPASKLTENSLVNGITMGQVENLILSGNKGIRDELRNILNARVETEGSDGRNTFQDWMNPAKVGSRIYAELLKNGMSGKEARTHLSDLMKDYETKYNEVLGKEPDLQFSINAQSIKDKAKEAVNNLDERLMKPDRLGTEKFYQETVKPVLGNSVSGFKDLVTRMTHAVVPRKGVPQDFLDSAMKMLGTREKTDFIIESTLNKMEEMMWTKDREASGKSTDDLSAKIASAVTGKKVMDTLSREEQIAFVDRIKRGEKQPNEDLQAVADFMRKMEDYWYGEARRLNPSLKWKQNHYRVLWKVIPGSMEDGFGGLFRKPLPGSKGFTKQSTLVDMSDGIAKGGVPYSYNPVTMWRVAMEDLTKYVTANRMMEEGKDLGYFKFVREFSKPPEGFVKVDDPMFRVYFQPKMTQKEMAEKGITDTKDARKGMITKAGEWYAEPNAARLLNNYISRDLIREVPAGRALMALKNITTAVELGLSAFHFVFETLDTVGSAVGLGLDKMWNRGVLKGDSTATVEGFRDIIRAPITPITYAKIGGRAIKYLSEKAEFMKTKEGKWFLEKVPDAEMFLDDMFNAGGRLAMAQDYKINSIGTFRQNLKANNYIGTTMRLIPALSEAMMKPLFETYIPRLKVGMFLTEYANALAKNSEKIGTGKFTRGQVARKLWDSVENRLGEMNFDTLFWNRTFKSAMQLMTRSVTWKLGNFRSMGGAFLGQAAELVAAIKDRRPPELQSNMAWLLGMSAVTATIGTIIQQMATGKPPKDLKDLIYPQIDPNDPDVRISLPTYWKDLVHAKHDPVKYVKSSASGWIGKMAEIWDNKDFYGVEVVHKDDPVPLKTWDALKHMVPLPFSVQGFMQMKEKHEPAHKMVSGFLGFGQAPKYISKTPAETLMDEMLQAKMPVGTRTAHEFEKTRMIQSIRRDLRSGNNAEADRTIQEGILNGKLTKRDLVNLYRSGNELPIATRFRHLNIDESLKVWEAADADERKILRPILFKKGGNIKNAEPEHRDDLRDRFRKAMEG